MNSSSNLLVLGVTGQVGKRVATNLKRREANFSVGSRRKANLEELMAYVGSVKDDTREILGREPLLLREWAKLHVNELLAMAGS